MLNLVQFMPKILIVNEFFCSIWKSHIALVLALVQSVTVGNEWEIILVFSLSLLATLAAIRTFRGARGWLPQAG